MTVDITVKVFKSESKAKDRLRLDQAIPGVQVIMPVRKADSVFWEVDPDGRSDQVAGSWVYAISLTH